MLLKLVRRHDYQKWYKRRTIQLEDTLHGQLHRLLLWSFNCHCNSLRKNLEARWLWQTIIECYRSSSKSDKLLYFCISKVISIPNCRGNKTLRMVIALQLWQIVLRWCNHAVNHWIFIIVISRCVSTRFDWTLSGAKRENGWWIVVGPGTRRESRDLVSRIDLSAGIRRVKILNPGIPGGFNKRIRNFC